MKLHWNIGNFWHTNSVCIILELEAVEPKWVNSVLLYVIGVISLKLGGLSLNWSTF